MKNQSLFFGFLTTSFILTITCNLKANAQSVNNWIPQALGIYQSQIWSGGTLASGTTEFKETNSGSIEGSYTMNEPGESVPGKLSQCQAIQIRVLRCVWEDRYGTGNLEVTFSENFSR
jgi:hypothetical protein